MFLLMKFMEIWRQLMTISRKQAPISPVVPILLQKHLAIIWLERGNEPIAYLP
ncbi:hypothetical protein VIBNISOn1_480011 [Vibrio nigripulchritudo SOn1]|uniref:Transposase n=1 Tax=Vibrio nigripulchritudo SOn1 TaxID=1238450 RepID=A0AAV2VU43_9VIBR|nr:hypothetical protein VIBNISOn1_480011 [Vibrio nigripulchritudo SOn1]